MVGVSHFGSLHAEFLSQPAGHEIGKDPSVNDHCGGS
jgi:hypothetical protein